MDKALEMFKSLSKVKAQRRVLFRLAQLYYDKTISRSRVSRTQSYDLNPKVTEYARLLAQSLIRIGRSLEALEIYKKALGIKDQKISLRMQPKNC